MIKNRNRYPGHFFAWLLLLLLLFTGFATAQEFNLSSPENITKTNASGQQITPATIIFQDRPYLFWSSNTVEATGDADFDIIYTTMEAGSWKAQTVLTDTSTGNDHTPQPIIFKGTMYLFWSSDDPDMTSGSPDILFSSFDGNDWSQAKSLTSGFNEMGDYNPWPVVFNSELYVFFEWFSYDSKSYEIGYISSDGSQWSDAEPITNSSSGHNLNPAAAVNGNSLLLSWESANDEFTGQGIDSSIVTRTLTSGNWSNYSSLSGNAGPRNQNPFSITYGGSTWVFWSTNSQAISMGSDFDIVARRFSSGAWDTTVYELSSGGSGNETGVYSIVYGERLVVSWISASTEFSPGEDTDIVLSLYDGEAWCAPIDISREDNGLEDAGGITYKSPAMMEYGGSLYIIWETNAGPGHLLSGNTWLMSVTFGEARETDWTTLLVMLFLAGLFALALILMRRKQSQR